MPQEKRKSDPVVACRVDRKMLVRIRTTAKEEHRTVSSLVKHAIDEYLKTKTLPVVV